MSKKEGQESFFPLDNKEKPDFFDFMQTHPSHHHHDTGGHNHPSHMSQLNHLPHLANPTVHLAPIPINPGPLANADYPPTSSSSSQDFHMRGIPQVAQYNAIKLPPICYQKNRVKMLVQLPSHHSIPVNIDEQARWLKEGTPFLVREIHREEIPIDRGCQVCKVSKIVSLDENWAYNKTSQTWEIWFKSLCSTSRHSYEEKRDKLANEKSNDFKMMVLAIRFPGIILRSNEFQLGCIKGSQKKKPEENLIMQKKTKVEMTDREACSTLSEKYSPFSLLGGIPSFQQQKHPILSTLQSLASQIHSIFSTPPLSSTMKTLSVYKLHSALDYKTLGDKFHDIIFNNFGFEFNFVFSADTNTFVSTINVPDEETANYLNQLIDMWLSNQPCSLWPAGNGCGDVHRDWQLLVRTLI